MNTMNTFRHFSINIPLLDHLIADFGLNLVRDNNKDEFTESMTTKVTVSDKSNTYSGLQPAVQFTQRKANHCLLAAN